MKKIILLIAAMAVIFGGIYFFQDTQENISGAYDSKYGRIDVDPEEKVSLDFDNSRIKVDGWEKNYVSIEVNRWFEKAGNLPEIAFSGNRITFKDNPENQRRKIVYQAIWPWFSLSQFKTYQTIFLEDTMDEHDFIIRVPKTAKLEVKSDILKATNSEFVYIKANNVALNDCRLPKEFIGDADYVEVRDSIISNKAVFHKKSGTMEDILYTD